MEAFLDKAMVVIITMVFLPMAIMFGAVMWGGIFFSVIYVTGLLLGFDMPSVPEWFRLRCA